MEITVEADFSANGIPLSTQAYFLKLTTTGEIPLPETGDEGTMFWETPQLFAWTEPLEMAIFISKKSIRGWFEGVLCLSDGEPVFGKFTYFNGRVPCSYEGSF